MVEIEDELEVSFSFEHRFRSSIVLVLVLVLELVLGFPSWSHGVVTSTHQTPTTTGPPTILPPTYTTLPHGLPVGIAHSVQPCAEPPGSPGRRHLHRSEHSEPGKEAGFLPSS
jgi:hypothetical protein